jgi:hypothetical protein
MSSKWSLGNVFFHTDLVVDRTQIKFGELLSTTQFIQEVINGGNGECFFDCEFVEGTKIRTHAPSTFFLEYHDHEGIIGAINRKNNTHFYQFMNNLSISFLWEKG